MNEFKKALPDAIRVEIRAKVRELIESYCYADCGPDDFGVGPSREAVDAWIDSIMAGV
jgi:hypothetical protein